MLRNGAIRKLEPHGGVAIPHPENSLRDVAQEVGACMYRHVRRGVGNTTISCCRGYVVLEEDLLMNAETFLSKVCVVKSQLVLGRIKAYIGYSAVW